MLSMWGTSAQVFDFLQVDPPLAGASHGHSQQLLTKKKKDKTTLFGVIVTGSTVVYQAVQTADYRCRIVCLSC